MNDLDRVIEKCFTEKRSFHVVYSVSEGFESKFISLSKIGIDGSISFEAPTLAECAARAREWLNTQ